MLPLLLLPMLPQLLLPMLLSLLSMLSKLLLLSPLPVSTRPSRPTWFLRPVLLATRSTPRFNMFPKSVLTPTPPLTPPTMLSTIPMLLELELMLDMPLLDMLESLPDTKQRKKAKGYERTTKELLPCCKNMNNILHEFASCYKSSHSRESHYLCFLFLLILYNQPSLKFSTIKILQSD